MKVLHQNYLIWKKFIECAKQDNRPSNGRKRNSKNNSNSKKKKIGPVLIGDPVVGKTACRGLAIDIWKVNYQIP